MGSHHLPSYLPSTPFSTTGGGGGGGGSAAGGAMSTTNHQSSTGLDATAASSSSSSYPLQSSSSGKTSSSIGRDQAQPYYQDYTARSSIGKPERPTFLRLCKYIPFVSYTQIIPFPRLRSSCFPRVFMLLSMAPLPSRYYIYPLSHTL